MKLSSLLSDICADALMMICRCCWKALGAMATEVTWPLMMFVWTMEPVQVCTSLVVLIRCTDRRTHTLTCTHTHHTHKRTHACTHAHTHTHTHAPKLSLILRDPSTLSAERKYLNFVWKHALVPILQLLLQLRKGAPICYLHFPLESLLSSGDKKLSYFYLFVYLYMLFLWWISDDPQNPRRFAQRIEREIAFWV